MFEGHWTPFFRHLCWIRWGDRIGGACNRCTSTEAQALFQVLEFEIQDLFEVRDRKRKPKTKREDKDEDGRRTKTVNEIVIDSPPPKTDPNLTGTKDFFERRRKLSRDQHGNCTSVTTTTADDYGRPLSHTNTIHTAPL